MKLVRSSCIAFQYDMVPLGLSFTETPVLLFIIPINTVSELVSITGKFTAFDQIEISIPKRVLCYLSIPR